MFSEEPIKPSSIAPIESSSNSTYTTVPNADFNQNEQNKPETTEQVPISTSTTIDAKHQRFPYCIVWTPIPLITTLIPSIGHTGICTSDGIIHDFAGSFYVGIDNMAFGKPCKYIMLNPTEEERAEWDKAIEKGDDQYNTEEHNLCINNCHSHCAYVLNMLNYNNKSNYTMFHIWWMLITKSKYISCMHIIKTYIGFIILVIIIILISFILKSNSC